MVAVVARAKKMEGDKRLSASITDVIYGLKPSKIMDVL